MSQSDFSSWSREQEATFVVYEEHREASQKKAWIAGIAAAAVIFVAMVGVYASVEPDRRDVTKGMNMSNLTKKKTEAAPPPAAEQK
jgi:hypothetical protein